MLEPLQLHNMMAEPDPEAGQADRQALIDLALQPGEEGFNPAEEKEPDAATDAQSIAEERYAQQMLNRRANMQAHQKAQP